MLHGNMYNILFMLILALEIAQNKFGKFSKQNIIMKGSSFPHLLCCAYKMLIFVYLDIN